MFDCTDVIAAVKAPPRDPRNTTDALRCIPRESEAGTVLLVGVVHDHPASTYRVARILEAISPDFLALELPPLAVPLFEMYARDVYTPPQLGGEMSMAVQAAGDVELMGIDGPSRTYLRLLAKTVTEKRIPKNVVVKVLKDIVKSSGHALTCRLAALVGAITPLRLRVYSHMEYDSTLLDTPTEQATHERTYLSQQRTFLSAVEVPESVQVIDGIREESMVTQLREMRMKGDVIAVVGMEHLDAIEALLSEPP